MTLPLDNEFLPEDLILSDEEMAAFAVVDEEDLDDAIEFWDRYASPPFKGALDNESQT